jgi:hypothetical protein
LALSTNSHFYKALARFGFHRQDQSYDVEFMCVALTRAWSINPQADLEREHVKHGDSPVELSLGQNEDQFEYV